MANIRIDGLPSSPGVAFTDNLHTSQGGKDYKVAANEYYTLFKPEKIEYVNGNTITLSTRDINAIVDASVAASVSLSSGTYEGQKVHVVADGAEIVSLTGAASYVVYITSNTGGAHMEWVNGGWCLANEITASYTDGDYKITKTAYRDLELNFLATGTTVTYTFTFPISANFLDTTYSCYPSAEGAGAQYFVMNEAGPKTTASHTGRWESTPGTTRLNCLFTAGQYE